MSKNKSKEIKQVKLRIPLSGKQKLLIFGGLVATGALGYLTGRGRTLCMLDNCMAKLYEKDSSLKDHLVNVVLDVQKDKLLGK